MSIGFSPELGFVVPGGGASGVSYTPISPDPSTNVQDALDWRANHVGSAVVIDSLADMDKFFPAVATVRTLDAHVWHTGDVILPAGDTIVCTPSSSWSGLRDDVLLVGDVDGPVMSGPLQIQGFTLVNTNAGGSSECISADSGVSLRPISIEHMRFSGSRAGSLTGSTVLGFNSCVLVGLADGFVCSGTHADVRFANVSVSGVGASFVGFVFTSTWTHSAFSFSGCSLAIPGVAQFGLAIDDTISLPSDVIFQLLSNAVSGLQGRLLRAGVGDMLSSDLRLVSRSNPALADWRARADAVREDVGNKLTVDLSSTNPQVVPFREGVSTPEVELTGSQRTTLFKDAGDNNNTYVEYSGPIVDASAQLFWTVSVNRAGGGANTLRGVMQRNDAPAYTGFVDVDATANIVTNGSTIDSFSGSAPVIVNPNDRFRVTLEDLDGATDAEVTIIKYGLDVSG